MSPEKPSSPSKWTKVCALALTCLLNALAGCRSAPPGWKPDREAGMSVSQDGRYIAFVGNGRGGSDLYVWDQQTGKVRRLTDSGGCERNVRFSPSGRFLTYTAGGRMADSPRSIYTLSLDGDAVRRVTNTIERLDTCPSFSEDESQITFCGNFAKNGGRQYEGDVFVMKSDGSNLRRLTQTGFNSDMGPIFYDRDQSILFESYKTPKDSFEKHPPMVISQVSVKGGDWHERVHLGRVNYGVITFPSSTEILLCSDYAKDFYHDIFYLRDLKAEPRSLNAGELGAGPNCLSYVPSQKAVYFFLNDLQIWRVGLDGKNPVRVADRSLFDDPMHWKPNQAHGNDGLAM